MIVDLTRGDPAGPARDHRRADAALVKILLVTPQASRAAEVVIAPELCGAAIIASEEHDRILRKAELSQQRGDAANIAIHARYHPGIGGTGFGLRGVMIPLILIGLVLEFAAVFGDRIVRDQQLQ